MSGISIAIIPARGGSKGIPKKNLKKINGTSLVYRAIEFAINTKLFDYTFCSTDDNEIAEEAMKLGNRFINFRPKEFSGDLVSDAELLKYEIENIEKHLALKVKDICLLQPTSPIRNFKDISYGKKLIQNDNIEAVWSVSEIPIKYHPYKILKASDQNISLFDERGRNHRARQELDINYIRNGVFYFFKRDVPYKYNSLLANVTKMVLINSPIINIDDLSDLKEAQKYFMNKESYKYEK